jgi:hypothetical protein
MVIWSLALLHGALKKLKNQRVKLALLSKLSYIPPKIQDATQVTRDLHRSRYKPMQSRAEEYVATI